MFKVCVVDAILTWSRVFNSIERPAHVLSGDRARDLYVVLIYLYAWLHFWYCSTCVLLRPRVLCRVWWQELDGISPRRFSKVQWPFLVIVTEVKNDSAVSPTIYAGFRQDCHNVTHIHGILASLIRHTNVPVNLIDFFHQLHYIQWFTFIIILIIVLGILRQPTLNNNIISNPSFWVRQYAVGQHSLHRRWKFWARKKIRAVVKINNVLFFWISENF